MTMSPATTTKERTSTTVPGGAVPPQGGDAFITHKSLIELAKRSHCAGIDVEPVIALCRPEKNFWVFKATVYKSAKCRGFVGYGDAHPGNVSPLIFNNAEMRMAETRAVNRALRKAYGIGLCSTEEIGSFPSPAKPTTKVTKVPASAGPEPGNGHGQPRLLRDRLCQLIRQHNLDPTQVKRYAADFCGTETLREASRELIEDFINQLTERATKDRGGLLCHLNSYNPQKDVSS